MSERQVAVIGGGLAGISAALDCAAEGSNVTLLESRRRLGGAAYSFTRNGILADNGQHVFLRCCSEYLGLLERLGALDLVTLQPRLDIPVLVPGERGARLRRRQLPAPLHLADSLARYRFLTPGERMAAARAMLALRGVDPDDPAADARCFGDWLQEQGQGSAAIESLWELIGRPTLNLEAGDASLAQAAYVFRVGLLEHRDAGDVGYARVPLSEIHDRAARRALERAGVEVRLGRGATAIVPEGECFRIETAGAPVLCADAVVVAVPHERAARLLPREAGVDRERLLLLGSSPIVNLHVVYDRRVLEVPFAAGARTPVQWMFDRTAGAGLENGQYLAVSLSAAREELPMTVDDLRSRYLPALADLLPRARGARVEEFFVTREHAATFRAAPGARALRPGARTALPGLALAGSWTDTGWPATMESAVRSGRAAARVALEAASSRERVAVAA
jgi:squalene-associated FAD-dependent desaturase